MKIVPATPDRWKDVEGLFAPNGAYGGCWCTWFLLPFQQWKGLSHPKRKALFKRDVEGERAPGLIAYDDDGAAIGWLRIGPRAATPTWNGRARASAPLDDAPADDEDAWAATCFFVRASARGEGVTSALLKAGIAYAKKNGARVLEACPIDTKKRVATVNLFVGTGDLFRRAGFKEVARRTSQKPLMRLELKAARKKAGSKR